MQLHTDFASCLSVILFITEFLAYLFPIVPIDPNNFSHNKQTES